MAVWKLNISRSKCVLSGHNTDIAKMIVNNTGIRIILSKGKEAKIIVFSVKVIAVG